MDYAFVDLQGFRNAANKFIVKEFSILTKNTKFSDIIKSPKKFCDLDHFTRRSARWLARNHHGLFWDDGFIGINELRETITPILINKLVYAKGDEKVKWIHEILKIEGNTATFSS